MGGNATAGL